MQDIVATAGSIALGRTGENLVRRVVLPNIRDGTGTVVLLHQRSGGDAPYPVAVTEDGDKIYWVVTSVDTGAAGFGKAELQWLGDGGEVLKSRIYSTYVQKALIDPGDPPDGWSDYVGQIVGSAESAKKSEEIATKAAEEAGKIMDRLADLEGFAPATAEKLGVIMVGDGLTIDDDGKLSVDTADAAEKDNTKPITSAAVYTQVGNINALLATI